MAKIKKKALLSSSLIVTQSNQLVEARYNLSLGEQRLLLTMISRIQPDDEDFKPYRISISELANFLGVARGSAYHECKKITKSLLGRVLEIQEPGRLLQIGWVSSADYIDGTGLVNLSFDPLLKPYLLQLKGNFTSCRIEMLLGFKSQYTIRMYTLLKQYEKLKEREIELVQLREMLGLSKNLYPEYKNFKQCILLPVKNEMAKKADLYFEFDEIKHGRRVGAIRFSILTKKDVKETAELPESSLPEPKPPPSPTNETPMSLQQLLALVPKQHRALKTVLTALESYEKKHGFDYVKRNILYSNAKAAKSYAGYLNNALKDDWSHDWALEQEAPVKKKAPKVWERQGFASQKEYDDFMYKKQMEAYGVTV
ncbi:MAG: RepB family plasmid replication initiator protein [Methylococcaceae bacterium]|nr:MAG: RepB family plasmid replication initiator protein [Methylococcaceae bacterium]